MTTHKHRLIKVFSLLLVSGAMLILSGSSANLTAQSRQYVLVVNASNSYRADADTVRNVVRQLYLKQRNDWPNNIASKPFARPNGSAEQQAMLRQILGMSAAQLAGHWIELKQRSGETKPRAVGSDGMLLRFVAKYPGAFGVVSRQRAASASGVKVLFTLR